jgi:hypothetical protein
MEKLSLHPFFTSHVCEMTQWIHVKRQKESVDGEFCLFEMEKYLHTSRKSVHPVSLLLSFMN